MTTTCLFGLIGYPLTHSFSPGYFARKFAVERIAARYEAFPLLEISGFKALLATQQLCGLNVTIPYKQAVMPLLTEVDAVALAIGAVNCISIKSGRTTGHNTDAAGFEKSLMPLLGRGHKRALVLGTGGAAKAVTYVLDKLNIPFLQVSRTKSKNTVTYDDVDTALIELHKIIINTTPLGMYPNVEAMPPLPYAAVGAGHLLYDLIYNPGETAFLAQGRERGATTKNGIEMLYLQAEESWAIWNS